MRLVNLRKTAINRTIQIRDGDPIVFSICPLRGAMRECLCEKEQRPAQTSVSPVDLKTASQGIGIAVTKFFRSSTGCY